jgi:hypothetical protein
MVPKKFKGYQVNALPSLTMVDTLRGDPHGSLCLIQRPLQVFPGLHQVVGLIHVALQFGLKTRGV